MTKKQSRKIALLLLLIACLFVFYALGHPEQNFPWSLPITYTIYLAYLALMVFFFIAPFRRNK